MAQCKKCKAPIKWIQTPDDKWMPCDEGLVEYKEDAEGEDWVVTDKGDMVRCTFEFQCKPTGVARIPHWATCPFSKEFHGRDK